MKKSDESNKMRILIKVDDNYNIIERKVINEKPIPNEVLDLITPILKQAQGKKSQPSR